MGKLYLYIYTYVSFYKKYNGNMRVFDFNSRLKYDLFFIDY